MRQIPRNCYAFLRTLQQVQSPGLKLLRLLYSVMIIPTSHNLPEHILHFCEKTDRAEILVYQNLSKNVRAGRVFSSLASVTFFAKRKRGDVDKYFCPGGQLFFVRQATLLDAKYLRCRMPEWNTML